MIPGLPNNTITNFSQQHSVAPRFEEHETNFLLNRRIASRSFSAVIVAAGALAFSSCAFEKVEEKQEVPIFGQVETPPSYDSPNPKDPNQEYLDWVTSEKISPEEGDLLVASLVQTDVEAVVNNDNFGEFTDYALRRTKDLNKDRHFRGTSLMIITPESFASGGLALVDGAVSVATVEHVTDDGKRKDFQILIPGVGFIGVDYKGHKEPYYLTKTSPDDYDFIGGSVDPTVFLKLTDEQQRLFLYLAQQGYIQPSTLAPNSPTTGDLNTASNPYTGRKITLKSRGVVNRAVDDRKKHISKTEFRVITNDNDNLNRNLVCTGFSGLVTYDKDRRITGSIVTIDALGGFSREKNNIEKHGRPYGITKNLRGVVDCGFSVGVSPSFTFEHIAR